MDSPHLAHPPKPSGGRISKLFVRGKVVSLGQDDEGEVLMWVQALTKTQHEEASIAAATSGTRKRLLYKAGYPDYDLLLEQMELEATVDDLVDGIIAAKYMNIIWVESELDLHTDPAWRENGRLDLIRMGDAQTQSGAEMSNEESAAIAELNQEYMTDWQRCAAARLATKRAELQEKSRSDLEVEFIEASVSIRTLEEQARQYHNVAIYYAMRPCSATSSEGGNWSHAGCDNHKTLYFRDMIDVQSAPDEIKEAVIAALTDLDSAADVLGG